MKYVPTFIVLSALLATIYMFPEFITNISWFSFWVYAPFIISLAFSVLFLSGKFKSQIVPISGAILSIFAIWLYIEAYTYEGTSGQVALIFAVMPIYQYIGMLIFSAIGYFLRRNYDFDF